MLFVAAVAALTAYWTGLSGPFLLDDPSNLGSIPQWLDGKLGLSTILFDRGGGTLGRPVSMGAFALNAWLGGYSPFSFKFGNLLIHLACGFAIYPLLKRLLRRDAQLESRSDWIASIVASAWLLHPLHASTVLYAVQRMAQLSTLLIVLGLLLYVAARERLEARRQTRLAAWGLLAGIPAMTALAFLAKENGILLPLLCTVVELGYYSRQRRPAPVRVFLGAYVAVPATLGALALTWAPARLLSGYAGRDFSPLERVLSQGRALCDYIGKILLPNPPRMGVFTDDFPISHGLLTPPTTLLAILLLVALTSLAWGIRRRLPTVFFGWFFFLAAHALEASPIALELYFEHRNYLPSVGLLTAAMALAAYGGGMLAANGVRTSRLSPILLIGTLAVLAFGTHGRARIWQSAETIAESSLATHPGSMRANTYVLAMAMDRGDHERADQALAALLNSPIARNRSMAHLLRLYTDCVMSGTANPQDLEDFIKLTPMPLTTVEAQPFDTLYDVVGKTPCTPLTDQMLGSALSRLADRAHQEAGQSPHIRMRYQAASFLVRAGAWEAALGQARLGWVPTAPAPFAVPLVLAQLGTGDLKGAENTWREAQSHIDQSNQAERDLMGWLRHNMDSVIQPTGQGKDRSRPQDDEEHPLIKP